MIALRSTLPSVRAHILHLSRLYIRRWSYIIRARRIVERITTFERPVEAAAGATESGFGACTTWIVKEDRSMRKLC